jgi:hypothetical protein
MTIIPIQNVWFDDAANSAMGEAFDHACKSLRNLGSAVPEVIAYLIIQAAKMSKSIDDTSMLVVSVGRDPPVPAYASVTLAA